jgi:hypothetical protein
MSFSLEKASGICGDFEQKITKETKVLLSACPLFSLFRNHEWTQIHTNFAVQMPSACLSADPIRPALVSREQFIEFGRTF